MKNIKSLFFTIFIFCNIQTGYSQLANNIFNQKDSFFKNDSQTIRFNLEIFNYLRNTEYFDVIEKGQTLFGALIQPTLSYQPYSNIMIKAGFQTRQDYGSTNLFSFQPVVCVSYFNHKWRHNFGSLQGNVNYGLIEPFYNIDRAVTNRIENGIQGIYTSDKLTFNNFLVWDEPTYRTTKNQERFFTGFVINRQLLKKKSVKLTFPLQGLLAHRGGQLNNNPNPIYSRVNAASGLKLNWQISSDMTLKTENYYVYSVDFSPTISQPYKNGHAHWHTLSLKRKNLELMLNYWNGIEFQSPVGSLIYNNYNIYNFNEIRQRRTMIMSRLLYTQKLNSGTFIDLRFEPFYDFEYRQIQYSYSVYLKILFNKVIGRI